MRTKSMSCIRWAVRSQSWNPAKEEWLKATSCVQLEEKERIQKFYYKKDSKSAMTGRLLLRKVINESLNIPYCDILLKRTEKGKPFLANAISDSKLCSFNFNVSHHGDFTVLAAEMYFQVGIDVMKTTYPGGSSVPNYFHTMRKQFTDNEWMKIKSQPSEWKQLQMFYRLWCLKESYVKAVGVGIGHDLQSLEFRIATTELQQQKLVSDSRLFLSGVELSEWDFEETKLDDSHHVAVALGPPVDPQSRDYRADATVNERSQKNVFHVLDIREVLSSIDPLRPGNVVDWTNFDAKREHSKA